MGDLLKYNFGTKWLDLGGGPGHAVHADQRVLSIRLLGPDRRRDEGPTATPSSPRSGRWWAPRRHPRRPPAAPTNLTATAVSSRQINLAWTDNATDETGFQVERATRASGPWGGDRPTRRQHHDILRRGPGQKDDVLLPRRSGQTPQEPPATPIPPAPRDVEAVATGPDRPAVAMQPEDLPHTPGRSCSLPIAETRPRSLHCGFGCAKRPRPATSR